MPMQRQEKEITERFEIDAVIERCLICHLAVAVDNTPYVVPVCFGYDGRYLYIHTALEGKKIDMIRRNPRVSFAMETDLRLLAAPSKPCKWSFAFESVVGQGRIEELPTLDGKTRGLDLMVQHYARDRQMPSAMPGRGMRVWRIHIDELTGKRSHPLTSPKP